VQLDVVPDGRPIHVEVVAAWLGAVEVSNAEVIFSTPPVTLDCTMLERRTA
jgi:hypothetical protein